MKKKDFLKRFLRSLNPARYHHISEQQLNYGFELFFAVFFLAFIIFSLIFIPKLLIVEQNIQESIQQLPKAVMNISVESDNPITLLSQPRIILDTRMDELNLSQEEVLGNSQLVLGQNNYYYRFFGSHNSSYNYSADLKTGSIKLFKLLFILLIPGIILLLAILFLTEFLLIIVLSGIIATFFTRKLDFRDVLSVSIHASLLPVLLFLIILPFYNLWLTFLILFILIFILGVIRADNHRLGKSSFRRLDSEGEFKSEENVSFSGGKKKSFSIKKRSSKNSTKKKNRHLEIWED